MSVALVFIIVLGALIFVHELGHFLMARRSGMKVEELGFGFPLKNRWTLVPTLRTSVISLNQLFIGKYNCYSSFSRMHNEFYREIIFGMNVIPHFKQKTK